MHWSSIGSSVLGTISQKGYPRTKNNANNGQLHEKEAERPNIWAKTHLNELTQPWK